MDGIVDKLCTVDTIQHADSVEWCPLEYMNDVLLCGTYQLLHSDELSNKQIRIGQLQVYCLDHTLPSSRLNLKYKVDTAGLLDIKWAPYLFSETSVFASVNSIGQLQLWSTSRRSNAIVDSTQEEANKDETNVSESSSDCVELLKTAPIADCLGLSLDWSNGYVSSAPRIVTSDSHGGLTLFTVAFSDIIQNFQWKGHDDAAWICAFDHYNGDVIYSGGDDCMLKVWDVKTCKVAAQVYSRFPMGVCSVQSSYHREHLFAVGCYDEHLRVFDRRQMGKVVSTVDVGGGVWRIKWDPFHSRYILTATMHNGFHVVDCSDAATLKVVAHYSCVPTHPGDVHCLGYGVDWCRMKPNRFSLPDCCDDANSDTSITRSQGFADSFLVASCSFYDHALQLWQLSV